MRDFRVIVASPYWALNGVNIFSANLVRGLVERGISARVLITEQQTDRVIITESVHPLPSDLPVDYLPVEREDSWAAHWKKMIRYLEHNAPCIYIPNSDWRHSIVCPKLSNNVVVVGVVHSDDPLHYDHVARLGRYWNAIVTTSQTIAQRVIEHHPDLKKRLTTIPIGVPIPGHLPARPRKVNSPLSIVYHGVLNQQQKRILDMVRIAQELSNQAVPFRLTIIGDGPERKELLEQAKSLLEEGTVAYHPTLPHDKVLDILAKQDAYLMTSVFEGMPNALIEAMGHGCVPVVTDISSGIPELVQHGVNGYRVPVGEITSFAKCLSQLQRAPEQRWKMSVEAYRTVRDGEFGAGDMVQRYLDLFERLQAGAKGRTYRRPFGRLNTPPQEVNGVSIMPGKYDEDIYNTELAVSWLNIFTRVPPRFKHWLIRLKLYLGEAKEPYY